MPIHHKPLSKIMINKLLDCYEKQKGVSGNPCLQEDLKGSLAALYKRGMIDTKRQDINGKSILCIIVTESGAKFLTTLDKK